MSLSGHPKGEYRRAQHEGSPLGTVTGRPQSPRTTAIAQADAMPGPPLTANPGSSERFLAAFHDLNPGVTSRAYRSLAVDKGGVRFASSYECLAAALPEGTTPARVLDLACGDDLHRQVSAVAA